MMRLASTLMGDHFGTACMSEKAKLIKLQLTAVMRLATTQMGDRFGTVSVLNKAKLIK